MVLHRMLADVDKFRSHLMLEHKSGKIEAKNAAFSETTNSMRPEGKKNRIRILVLLDTHFSQSASPNVENIFKLNETFAHM